MARRSALSKKVPVVVYQSTRGCPPHKGSCPRTKQESKKDVPPFQQMGRRMLLGPGGSLACRLRRRLLAARVSGAGNGVEERGVPGCERRGHQFAGRQRTPRGPGPRAEQQDL